MGKFHFSPYMSSIKASNRNAEIEEQRYAENREENLVIKGLIDRPNDFYDFDFKALFCDIHYVKCNKCKTMVSHHKESCSNCNARFANIIISAYILVEKDKSYCIMSRVGKKWIPKSQVKKILRKYHKDEKIVDIMIPVWLAKEKGLL